MDLNRLILWIAGVSCSLNLLFSLRSRDSWGWRAILTGLLITLYVGLKTVPQFAGYIVGSGWFLLVLLPGLMQRLVNQMLVRRRYAAAMLLSRISAWLHPFDSWSDHPDIVQALRWYHEGRTDDATSLLSRLGRLESPMGRLAVVMRAQQTGDWEQLLAWLDSHRPEMFRHDENLVLARLQALGELGRRQEMLHAYQRLLNAHEDGNPEFGGAIALRVAALAGLPAAVDLLTDAMSSSLPRDAEQYWRLTARQVAGADVLDEFRSLQSSASPYLSAMIDRRITEPLPPMSAGELDAAALQTRDQLIETIAHETSYALMSRSSRRRPQMTWSIAIVLSGVFLREMPGGSANMINLFYLGALRIPMSLTPGQEWRILTAGVLHFGPLHLAMNLLGLLYFGPKLERAWGPVRMAGCYITATVVSMALAPFLVSIPPRQGFVDLVGASGGVMGLLGAIIGHLTVGWWRGRSRRVTRQLGMLLLLVGLQTAFDLSTPNVSFACHLLGLLTGFTIAVVLGTWSRQVPAT